MQGKIVKIHEKCYKIDLKSYQYIPFNFRFLLPIIEKTLPTGFDFIGEFTKNNLWSNLTTFRKNNPSCKVWYIRSANVYQFRSSVSRTRSQWDKSKYDYHVKRDPTYRFIFKELGFRKLVDAEAFLPELNQQYMLAVLSKTEEGSTVA